jgi:anti-anti-sigma factor
MASPPVGSATRRHWTVTGDVSYWSNVVGRKGGTVFTLRIQKLEDTTVIRCAGRMVIPYADVLRNAVLRQLRIRTLVLDLADVVAVDAAGLGILVSLRAWAIETRTALKLMNVTPKLEKLLELTNLKSAFEVCSGREMLALLCRAINETESVGFKTVVQDTNRIDETSGDGSRVIAGEALHTG